MMTSSGTAGRADAGWSGLLHNLTTSGFGVAVQTLCAALLLGLFSLGSRPDVGAGVVPANARRLVGHPLVLGCLPRPAHRHGPCPSTAASVGAPAGAGTSAAPGVAPLCRAYCWVTLRLGPWYHLVGGCAGRRSICRNRHVEPHGARRLCGLAATCASHGAPSALWANFASAAAMVFGFGFCAIAKSKKPFENPVFGSGPVGNVEKYLGN